MESSRTSLASRSPRGHILKSLALALASALASKPQVLGLGLEALGPRNLSCPRLEDSTIFEPLKFCRKTPETSRKICKYLFYFAQLQHRLSQPGLPLQMKFHQRQKCDKTAYCFFSFSFFLAFFAYTNNNIEDQGPRDPLKSIFASQFKCTPGRNG